MPAPVLRSRVWLVVCLALLVGGVVRAENILRRARPLEAAAPPGTADAAAAAAAAATAQQAARATPANSPLRRALDAIDGFRQAQAAARAAAQGARGGVPNGLQGLVVDPGVANDPSRWQGASRPAEQGKADGRIEVTVTQSQQKAILTWQKFDVGERTDLHFDQTAGGADVASWIVLNRVLDPALAPSRILGSIRAEGQVYVLNRNGILFGGTSQVNVGSLVLSSLDFAGGDRQFLTGIVGASFGGSTPGGAATGAVTIDPGARLQIADYGQAVLLGAEVRNGGTIEAPDGQLLLVGGGTITLGASSSPTLRGLQVTRLVDPGPVENTGILSAPRGNVTLRGGCSSGPDCVGIAQRGLVTATTSATANGSIAIGSDAVNSNLADYTRVELGPGSVTQVLPDDDGKKFIGYKQSDFAPSLVRVGGQKVILEEGSTVYVPSGTVTLGAVVDAQALPDQSRVYLAPGSRVDVSGLRDVERPMESNTLTAQLRANELRDNPILRNGPLRGRTVSFDARLGTGVADFSGYYDLVQRDVRELMVQGGTVNLFGNTIITREGSIIDLSGGSLSYRAGYVTSTVLIDPTGKPVRIENAVAGVAYVGIEGDFVVEHGRWGVTETYSSSMRGTMRRYEPGYTQGASAGTLNLGKAPPTLEPFPDNPDGLYTPRATGEFRILDGTVLASTVVGPRQRQAPTGSTSPTQVWRERPVGATLNVNQSGDVVITDRPSSLPPSFGPDTVVDAARADELLLPAAWFDGQTFGNLGITHQAVTDTGFSGYTPTYANFSAGGHLTIGRGVVVNLGDGGRFGFDGTGADVEGSIVAPGGSISFQAINPSKEGSSTPGRTFRLGTAGVLDTAGRFTNDALDGAEAPLRPLNGGSVSITASDVTLERGSVIDVSAGARLSASGNRLSSGSGGSISINVDAEPGVGAKVAPGAAPPDQRLVLDGRLLGYSTGLGGASGGSLSLTTGENLIVGRALPPGADGTSRLITAEFFDQGGFSRFTLVGERSVTVTAGTLVQPAVESFVLPTGLPEIPSGTRLADLASRQVLAPGLQGPVSLTLSTAAGRPFDNLASVPFSRSVTVESGAQLLGPPGSRFSFNSVNALSFDGIVSAPGGVITLTGSTAGSIQGSYPAGKAPDIRLGPDARLLASGYTWTVLASGVQRRTVESGGSIVLSTDRAVVIDPSAVLDVSGRRATADVALPPGSGARTEPLAIDGSAGSIGISAQSGTVAGQLRLAPGGASGDGGTLTVRGPIALGQTAASSPGSRLSLGADRLDASGADTLVLVATPSGSTSGPSLLFDGSVDLSARRSLVIQSPGLGLSPSSPGGSTVTLSASSVVLEGVVSAGPPATSALNLDGSLTVRADTIDFVNTLRLGSVPGTPAGGFGNATFQATGSISFSDHVRDVASSGAGLYSTGALVFDAAQLYVARVLDPGDPLIVPGVTVQSDRSIAVRGNGNPAPVPFSYGNTFTFRSPRIDQGGVVRAPQGTVVLQGTGPDGTVNLLPGSVTSGSLEGQSVLFNSADGQLLSGGTFFAYSTPGAGPVKSVRLDAPSVNVQKGAVIDVSGGGDLVGYSFVPGNGGSSNILQTSGAFAILPARGTQPAPAGGSGTLLDPGIRPGDVVWLQGLPGVPDGFYTRLPAQYALLPGALLVQPLGGSYASAPASITRPDGAIIAAGYQAVAGTPIRASTFARYLVMPRSVFLQYSDLRLYSFDTYARELAASAGLIARVPDDAGSAVLSASRSLVLQGTGRFGAGPDALLGTLDISAPKIALVGGGTAAPDPSFLAVDVESLQSFGAGSVLLGGTRASSTDAAQPGTRLEVNASEVLVRTGASGWTGPEILLAATDLVTVADGSKLQASGVVSRDTSDLLLQGDGALLRLSTGTRVGVIRNDAPGGGATGAGVLQVGSAELSSSGSLTLYGSRGLALSPNATLSGPQLDLASTRVNLGDAPAGTDGATLGPDTIARLSGATDLLIRATQSIHLYSGLVLGARTTAGEATLKNLTLDGPLLQADGGGAGASQISAGHLTLRNAGGTAIASGGDQTLSVDADTLTLGPGQVQLGGFGRFQVKSVDTELVGKGGLDIGGELELQTGLIRTAAGASYTVSSSGNLRVDRGARPPSSQADAAPGGRIILSGADVSIDALIVLPAGRIEIAASGGLQLGSATVLDVHGVAEDFQGQLRSAPAGSIVLRAGGALDAVSGAVLDVSGSSRGGTAGDISLTAGGLLSFAADARATALPGVGGGGFTLDAAQVQDLVGLNNRLDAAGFTAWREYRLRSGDLVLGAEDRLTAHRVVLQADSGSVVLGGQVNAGGTDTTPGGGQVRLIGGAGVSLLETAVIDAHAAQVPADAFPAASGQVELVATGGRIDVAPGASIDLSGGKTAGGGLLVVRAPRSGVDVAVDRIAGSVRARSVVVQGSRAYSASTLDAALGNQMLGEAASWMAGAAQIRARLVGGGSRLPEVVVAPAMTVTSGGDLTVQGPLSLASLGAPGNLGLSAAGNLSIDGTLSDGFASADRASALGSGRSFGFELLAGRDIQISAGALVRTGTGSIRLVAGGDIRFAADTSVLYTAGARTPTASGFSGAAGEFPTGGGDVELSAGRDIVAPLPSQTTSAWLARAGSTQWNQSQADSTVLTQSSWSIIYPNFQQVVGALGGGDVRVSAGRDVVQLQVALPTSGQLTTAVGSVPRPGDLIVRGGGDLTVNAGRDILGGLFVLGQGAATLRAAGDIEASGQQVNLRPSPTDSVLTSPRTVAPLLGLMDATATLVAGGRIELEAAFDPMRQGQIVQLKPGGKGTAFTGYTDRTAVDALAISGNVTYQNDPWASVDLSAANGRPDFRVDLGGAGSTSLNVLFGQAPPTLRFTALNASVRLEDPFAAESDLTLAAADRGTLEVLARDDVLLPISVVRLENLGAAYRRGALFPYATVDPGLSGNDVAVGLVNAPGNQPYIHGNDPSPVRLYALDGSVCAYQSGSCLPAGQFLPVAVVSPNKTLDVYAGKDILTGTYNPVGLGANPVSRFQAGRDVVDVVVSASGPGTVLLEAGRDLVQHGYSDAVIQGGFLRSVGNPTGIAGLARDRAADIVVLTGTAGGVDYDGFTTAYLDAANPSGVVRTYLPELRSYLASLGVAPGADAALITQFRALPEPQRQVFLFRVYFEELKQTGIDYNDPTSPRYQSYDRGFAAVSRLFPNSGQAGAPLGNALLAGKPVETQSPGSLTVLAPYGRISVGTELASSSSTGGIVTRRGGDIRLMADENIDLFTSRVFTLQGGDITMWTSNGSITAGAGAKTSVLSAPLTYVTSPDAVVTVNVFGLQTGAGIGVLDALQGSDPNRKRSRLDLIAPRGEVNAGDAGIRVVGDLNIAAQIVVGVENIQVTGSAVGVPKVTAVNVAALSTASQLTQAATKEGVGPAAAPRTAVQDLPSIVTVEVVGYETTEKTPGAPEETKKKKGK